MASTVRRASAWSQTSNERTPLLLPPDNTLPSDGIDAQSIASSGSDDDQRRSSSRRNENETFSTSPVTVVIVLVVGVFIAQLDTSFVLATHSMIASEFGQLSNSSWLISAYALAMCAVQPCYGKISDVFGRKELLIVAYGFFIVGSGVANSLSLVVFGRVIAGIGGAGCNALVSLIILDLVPLRQVAALRSYVNIAATTGRSLGGPVGGALADLFNWRWSFILQCPLLAIAAILAYLLVPNKAHPEQSKSSALNRLKRIDFAGAGLLAVTITALMLAIELAGEKLPWNHPIVLTLVVGSLASGALFVVTETYWAPEPVFPLHLLAKRDVVFSYLVLGLQIAAQLGMMFSVPVYFQVTQNASASLAGAHLFPAVGGNAVGALISGVVIKRTGRYKFLAVFATLTAGLCYVLLILRWRGHTNVWESLYIIPGGFGTGMAEAAIFIGLTASVDPSLQAIALSGLFQSTNIGLITGLAASSAVFQVVLKRELEQNLTGFKHKDEIIKEAVSNITYVLNLKGRLHEVVIKAYVRGLEYTHGVSLCCVAIAFLASLIIRQRKL